jgi:hypothetical protein
MARNGIGLHIQGCQRAEWIENGGHPKNAESIFVKLAKLTSEWNVLFDRSCVAIEFVQSLAMRNPESSRPIFPCEVYLIRTDACGDRRIMGISGGFARSWIESIKSSACCQPKYSKAVLIDAFDGGRRAPGSLCVDAIVNKGLGFWFE